LTEVLSGSTSSHLVLSLELVSEFGLDVGEDLVEEGIDLGFVEEVNSVAEVLLLVVLEVSLVMDIFVLDLSDFLDFVVVDVELLSVEGGLVKLSLGLRSLLGILEANESIESLSFLGEELNVFDFTVLSEQFFELLFGGVGREVFDVEVASLLGVLVSKHLLGLFHLSLRFLQCLSDVKLLSVEHLSIELLDSSHGALRSSFSVLGVSVANEGESTFLVFHHVETEDGSVLAEHLLEVIFRVAKGEVFNVDVVE